MAADNANILMLYDSSSDDNDVNSVDGDNGEEDMELQATTR